MKKVFIIAAIVCAMYLLVEISSSIAESVYCGMRVASIVGDEGSKKFPETAEERASHPHFTFANAEVTWEWRERKKCYDSFPTWHPLSDYLNKVAP